VTVRHWGVRRLVLVLAACGHPDAPLDTAACTPSIVYLNRTGGTYTHSPVDDATMHQSIVIDTPRTVAPWPGDSVGWSDLTACIRTALAVFPVQVTETDPGTMPHVEIVFTDTYWVDSAVTHVFPSSCRRGHQIEFMFGTALATPTRACELAMGALAEMTMQLGPAENCLDFTSPANDCGVRFFLDKDLDCVDPATNLPSACRCDTTKTTQNSYGALAQYFHGC
jgi:hypothetical protein